MIRIFLLTIMLCGCANYQALLDKIPNAGFEKFKYSRAGNVSSASIVCEKANIDGEGISIDRLYILENTPFVNIDVELIGYHRKFGKGQSKTITEALK